MKTKLFLFVLIGFLTSFEARAVSYAAKDKVEAFWHGSWYKAVIERVEGENLYYVHFSGYWASRNQILPANLLRSVPDRNYPDVNSLKEGDAVEFLEGDHWHPAVFVRMENEKARIRFADKKQPEEKLVPIQHLWEPPQRESKKVGK